MSSGAKTVNLGFVVYLWGKRPQDRLLVEFMGHEAAQLRREGRLARFWFDRYDARGPHVFAILTVPLETRAQTLQRVRTNLAAYLASHPSNEVLSRRRLEQIHEQTHGRCQCEVDGYPGFAPNNSFVTFDHPADGYPFWLSQENPSEGELWNQVGEVSLWAVRQLNLGTRPFPQAVRWISRVDQALREAGEEPGAYWRLHLATLIPFVGGSDDADLTELAEAIGDERMRDLAAQWEGSDDVFLEEPPVSSLVRLALDTPGHRRWSLLREIDHVTLKQLGLPVALHITLVLYAWLRSRTS